MSWEQLIFVWVPVMYLFIGWCMAPRHWTCLSSEVSTDKLQIWEVWNMGQFYLYQINGSMQTQIAVLPPN